MDKPVINGDRMPGRRLNETHISVYKWAVARGFVSVKEVTDVLGLTQTEASEAMDALVAADLMESRHVGGLAGAAPEKRWRVLNPQVAAARLAATEVRLRQLMIDLSASRQSFDDLFHAYSSPVIGHAQTPVDVLGSLAEVVPLIDAASAACTVEMISCQPGGGRPPEQLEQAERRDVELLERGARIRTLYQHSSRHHAPTRTYVDRITKAGGEVRTSTELFGRLIVFDRAVAFIPHHSVPGGAAVIRDPSTISFLCDAFDRAWDLATPFIEGGPHTPEVSDLHRSVLRLLREGARDESMARRLGVSLRTCRKYVAEIFQALGAESRFQAGYYTAVRGLLDVSPSRDGLQD